MGVDDRGGCHSAVGWQTPAKTAFGDAMSLISGRWRRDGWAIRCMLSDKFPLLRPVHSVKYHKSYTLSNQHGSEHPHMPLPSIHPLPPNPTTGHQPLASLGGTRSTLHPPPASASSAGVSRETLKSLQDVYWSDDEVRALS